MASDETAGRSSRPDVTVVSITVTDRPRVGGRPRRRRVTAVGERRTAAAVVAATLAVGLGAIVLSTPGRGEPAGAGGAARAEQPQPHERAEIAGALGYPYPLRCLTITISASNPDYARADVDRTGWCGRYHGYVNASLHRVAGEWRLAFDEGQLFVPNGLLGPCRPGQRGCTRPHG